METAPTSIEVLLRPTLGQSDEPSDLRGSLSPTSVYSTWQSQAVTHPIMMSELRIPSTRTADITVFVISGRNRSVNFSSYFLAPIAKIGKNTKIGGTYSILPKIVLEIIGSARADLRNTRTLILQPTSFTMSLK